LRQLLSNVAGDAGISQFLPQDVRANAEPRRIAHLGVNSDKLTDNHLLDYMDFADLSKSLFSLRREVECRGLSDVSWLAKRLTELTPGRNRICHSRPLEVDDMPQLMDLAKDTISKYPMLELPTLRETMERLRREPSYVLGMSIPSFWSMGVATVQHNLPAPEFDDTGFVGRKQDRKVVDTYLRSSNPVVTIVGEGGAGKTALAMRCLYDLVDRDSSPFELIVWVSLKTRTLTAGGIQTISTAISTTAGLIDSISNELAMPSGVLGQSGGFESIIEYMREFKVLLAIDNLETLQAEKLRELYTNVPSGSKILITSRVGLGKVEVRYALGALAPADSAILFRSFARFLNRRKIASADEKLIVRYCERLHNNPLLIKWFISALTDGYDPQKLLAPQSRSLDQAIKFCFENLYRSLSEEQRKIVEVLSCAGRPLAEPEVRYLLQGRVKEDALQWSLNTLHQSSMLRTEIEMLGSGIDAVSKLGLTDIASHYVAKMARPRNDTYDDVQKKLRDLHAVEQYESVRRSAYRYDPLVVHCSNRYEHVAARDLSRAIGEIRDHRFEKAKEYVERARSLAPDFSEIERVSAMLSQELGDNYAADLHYKAALESNPGSIVTLYTYSYFLLRSDRYEEGLSIIEKALMLVGNNDAILSTRKAIFLMRLGRYAESAILYDAVLKGTAVQYAKWRLTTTLESAECYRRWAETFSSYGDRAAGREKLGIAINLLRSLPEHSSREARITRVVWKVANDSLYLFHTDDMTWCSDIISWIESCIKEYGCPEEKPRSIYSAIRNLDRSELSARLFLLQTQFEGKASHGIEPLTPISAIGTFPGGSSGASAGCFVGKVIRKRPGALFAFIQEDNTKTEYFTHRNEIDGETRWDSIYPGVRVEFELGANAKGVCAVKVKIL